MLMHRLLSPIQSAVFILQVGHPGLCCTSPQNSALSRSSLTCLAYQCGFPACLVLLGSRLPSGGSQHLPHAVQPYTPCVHFALHPGSVTARLTHHEQKSNKCFPAARGPQMTRSRRAWLLRGLQAHPLRADPLALANAWQAMVDAGSSGSIPSGSETPPRSTSLPSSSGTVTSGGPHQARAPASFMHMPTAA